MKRVGIRELKDRLSAYLREVASGELIVVTDRGKPVAEIAPPGATGRSGPRTPGLAALLSAGRASGGADNDPSLYPLLDPLLPPGRGKELLDEERGDR